MYTVRSNAVFAHQHSNPVDTDVAYKTPSDKYGTSNDPMVGEKIGGLNVFGGGLAPYNVWAIQRRTPATQ